MKYNIRRSTGSVIVNDENDVKKFSYNNEQQLLESNIIRDVMENLDKDVVEPKTNLTSIDFNTRLTHSEIGGVVALQMLDVLNVGGSACSLISRSIKRNKVSLNGLGREEKVKIVQGEREHEQEKGNGSLFGKIKGFLGGNSENK